MFPAIIPGLLRLPRMKQLLILTLVWNSLCVDAQEVFFKSEQTFRESDLQSFYSALSIHDSLVIFNANDYQVYAYNKNNGQLVWSFNLGRKTNSQQYISGGYIWMNTTNEEGIRVGLDGKNEKRFPFSIFSKPFVKNGMVYLTGLYDAGNVMAYDMKADSVVWYEFVAHGCDTDPYYLEDRIYANAEGNNWLQIDYSGKKRIDCDEAKKDDQIVHECMDHFILLTHDGKKLSGRAAEKLKLDDYARPQQLNAANRTFLLYKGRFAILGNNLKGIYQSTVAEKFPDLEEDEEPMLLKVTDKEAWLLYSQQVVRFDVEKKRFSIAQDLSQWNPHTVVLDQDRIWLVSKNDGLLYGMEGAVR